MDLSIRFARIVQVDEIVWSKRFVGEWILVIVLSVQS